MSPCTRNKVVIVNYSHKEKLLLRCGLLLRRGLLWRGGLLGRLGELVRSFDLDELAGFDGLLQRDVDAGSGDPFAEGGLDGWAGDAFGRAGDLEAGDGRGDGCE